MWILDTFRSLPTKEAKQAYLQGLKLALAMMKHDCVAVYDERPDEDDLTKFTWAETTPHWLAVLGLVKDGFYTFAIVRDERPCE